MSERAAAPIFVDAMAAAQWLGHHFNQGDVLGRRIHDRALDLLEAVTLALRDFDKLAELDEADRSLACLRVLVLLAHERELLDGGQLLYVTELLDRIGRQLGGWLRSLDEHR